MPHLTNKQVYPMSVQVNSRLISTAEMVQDIKNLLTYDSNFAIWTKQGVKSPIFIVDIAKQAGFKVFVINDMRYVDKFEADIAAAKLDGHPVVVVFPNINKFFDFHYAYWDTFTEMLTHRKVGNVKLSVGDFIVATGELNNQGNFFDTIPSKITERLLNYRII